MTKRKKISKTHHSSIKLSNCGIAALNRHDVNTALARFAACDWGTVSNSRWAQNDEAYKSGGRIMARYVTPHGRPFLLVSESGSPDEIVILDEQARQHKMRKRAC